MITVHELCSGMARTYGDGAEADVALHLLRFLYKHGETTHITLQLVKQIAHQNDRKYLDQEIVRTLQYLAGDAIQLLEIRFELFGEDGSLYELDDDEVREIIDSTVNPITGEIEEGVANRVAIYFSPTKNVRVLFENVAGEF